MHYRAKRWLLIFGSVSTLSVTTYAATQQAQPTLGGLVAAPKPGAPSITELAKQESSLRGTMQQLQTEITTAHKNDGQAAAMLKQQEQKAASLAQEVAVSQQLARAKALAQLARAQAAKRPQVQSVSKASASGHSDDDGGGGDD